MSLLWLGRFDRHESLSRLCRAYLSRPFSGMIGAHWAPIGPQAQHRCHQEDYHEAESCL